MSGILVIVSYIILVCFENNKSGYSDESWQSWGLVGQFCYIFVLSLVCYTAKRYEVT